jgi:putative Holliday junction resolvase
MKLLGIDYGLKKIGVAISAGKLAEPLRVIKVETPEKTIEKIVRIAGEEGVDKIIIGMSEGKTAEETKEFGNRLQKKTALPIDYFDETLSTQEAQALALESGMSRKKRKNMEDAFAACIMLQNYLDLTPNKSD